MGLLQHGAADVANVVSVGSVMHALHAAHVTDVVSAEAIHMLAGSSARVAVAIFVCVSKEGAADIAITLVVVGVV